MKIAVHALLLSMAMAVALGFVLPVPAPARSLATTRNLFGGGGGAKEGGGGKNDMSSMMESLKKANQIGQKTQALQKELQDMRITGASANGKVKVVVNGQQVPLSCEVDPSALEEGANAVQVAVTEAMIAAHRDSMTNMGKKMQELYQEMGLPPLPTPGM